MLCDVQDSVSCQDESVLEPGDHDLKSCNFLWMAAEKYECGQVGVVLHDVSGLFEYIVYCALSGYCDATSQYAFYHMLIKV